MNIQAIYVRTCINVKSQEFCDYASASIVLLQVKLEIIITYTFCNGFLVMQMCPTFCNFDYRGELEG